VTGEINSAAWLLRNCEGAILHVAQKISPPLQKILCACPENLFLEIAQENSLSASDDLGVPLVFSICCVLLRFVAFIMQVVSFTVREPGSPDSPDSPGSPGSPDSSVGLVLLDDVPRLERARLSNLDGLRGLCALMVALGHANGMVLAGGAPFLYLNFFSAVSMFVTLSGFSLAVSHKPGPAGGFRSFMWKRFVRIAPVYYFSLLVCVQQFIMAMSGHSPEFIAETTILTLIGLHSVRTEFVVWDAPVWTVSALWVCYIFFIPLRKLCVALVARVHVVAVILCAWTIQMVMVFIVYYGTTIPWFEMHFNPGFRLLQFFCGIAIGMKKI
jgi:hypothetical protein